MSEHTRTPMKIETWDDLRSTIARLTAERDAAHAALRDMPTEPFRSVGLTTLTLAERIKNVEGMWRVAIKDRDTALAQCKAWREEAEAWRAWWPLNVKSDTTERRTATEPNEADIIATDAWDVLEAARARTDALAKKQGDTSCLE